MAAYMYSVNPKRLIKTLKDVPAFRVPKTLELEIDDVKECLKFGTVYRRFTGPAGNVRVTVDNVERLHNEEFMTPEQYKQFIIDNNSQGHSQVREPEMKKIDEDVAEPVKEKEVEPSHEVESTNNGENADNKSVQDSVNVDDNTTDAGEVENKVENVSEENDDKTDETEENDTINSNNNQKPQPQFNKKRK